MDQSGLGGNHQGAAAPETCQMNGSQGGVNITFPEHPPISCSHRSCILSPTSSWSIKAWRWAGELSELHVFLHNFWRYFKQCPTEKALAYLRKCVPPVYFREIDTASHLNEALSNLSLWTESNTGLTRHINRSLRAIPTANNIWEDKAILKRQITLVKRGLRISTSYWVTFPFAQSNFVKYSDPRAFGVMRSELVSSAQRKDDVRGVLNYARDFLRILLIQVSLVNECIVYLGSLGASPHSVPNRPNNSKAEI